MGHSVSATTTLMWCYSTKATIDNVNKLMWLYSNKTLLKKKAVSLIWPVGHNWLTPVLYPYSFLFTQGLGTFMSTASVEQEMAISLLAGTDSS